MSDVYVYSIKDNRWNVPPSLTDNYAGVGLALRLTRSSSVRELT